MKLVAPNQGFTALELLVVIAIIAVLSAIIVPVYQSIRPSLRLSTTARELVADLRYSQQRAVTEQLLHGIVFDLDAQQYRIVNFTTGATLKTVTLQSPLAIATTTGITSSTVSFNATGAATDSGTVALTNAIATTTIEIKPSGYVKIID